MLWYLLRSVAYLNARLQISQVNFFTPVCTTKCPLKLMLPEKPQQINWGSHPDVNPHAAPAHEQCDKIVAS